MRIGKPVAIAAALLLTVSVVWLYLFLKGHGFSTRQKPSGIERFLALRVRSLAIPSSADQMSNPFAADPEAIAGGADHFLEQCAICHALDGSGKTDMGVGLYPPPPDLRKETQSLSDGAILYIIRNGIRFTGYQLGICTTTTSGISSHLSVDCPASRQTKSTGWQNRAGRQENTEAIPGTSTDEKPFRQGGTARPTRVCSSTTLRRTAPTIPESTGVRRTRSAAKISQS